MTCSFLVLKTIFKLYLSIWNGILNFIQVTIETKVQYLFLKMQNEKCYPEVTLLLLSEIGDPFWWAIHTYISSELLEESED